MKDQDSVGSEGLNEDEIFRVSPQIAHREVEDQILLLLPDETSLFTLNDAGRLVWLALIDGRNVGEMTEAVAERFGIPRSQASADVRGLLGELEERSIISRASAGS